MHRPIIRENEKEKSPGFTGTEFQAKQVAELFALGMPIEKISKVLKVTETLLRFYYTDEVETAEALVNAEVAKTALDMAKSGRNPEMTQFWLKSRAGWMDKSRLEVTGADGGPVELLALRESLVKVISSEEASEQPPSQVEEDERPE